MREKIKYIVYHLKCRVMMKIKLCWFGIVVLFSCQDNSEQQIEEAARQFASLKEVCEVKSAVELPEGYAIDTIGDVDLYGSVDAFQMVNETVGYAVGGNMFGGYVDVFKTTDGGRSWSDLNINIPKSPISMAFRDEQYGLISVHDVTGCPPPNCQNRCVILKTTDGGKSWKKIEYQSLKGVLYHLTFDEDGKLYALLGLEEQTTLMVSDNSGESWDVLYASPDLDLSLVTFGLALFRDNIYLVGQDATVVLIDRQGNFIKTIETPEVAIWDLKVVDENTFIIAHSGPLVKSSDGGDSWKVIYDNSARIIGFDTEEVGLAIVRKSVCPTDVYQVNDLFVASANGGDDWVEADKVSTNLRASYKNSQRMQDGHYLVMIGNRLFKITKDSLSEQE